MQTRGKYRRRPLAHHRGKEDGDKRCCVLQHLPCPQLLLLTSALPQPARIIFAFYIYLLSSALWDRYSIFFSVLSDETPAVRVWGGYPNRARPAWNTPPANEHTQPFLPSVPSSGGVTEMVIVILHNEYLAFNNDIPYSL